MVGEHIRALKDGRWNHAIDCGDETVIHLASDGAAASRVRRSYRPEFVSGAEIVEVVTHRERTFPATEVVARAYSRISDAGLAAMFRDSEAFAEWCVTGRLTTPQNTAVLVPGVPPAPPAARAGAAARAEAEAPPAKANGAPARRKAAPAAKAKAKRAPAKAAPAPAKAPGRKAAPRKAAARPAAKGAPRAKRAAKKVAAKRPGPARRSGARRGKG